MSTLSLGEKVGFGLAVVLLVELAVILWLRTRRPR